MFDLFWGHLGTHSGIKLAQERPIWAREDHRELQKYRKLAFAETSQKLKHFKVFGVRGCPRQPRKAQEDSPEAPGELQNLKKSDPKMDHFFINSWTNFWGHFGVHFWGQIHSRGDKKWDQFWSALAPANRAPNVAKTENQREW